MNHLLSNRATRQSTPLKVGGWGQAQNPRKQPKTPFWREYRLGADIGGEDQSFLGL